MTCRFRSRDLSVIFIIMASRDFDLSFKLFDSWHNYITYFILFTDIVATVFVFVIFGLKTGLVRLIYREIWIAVMSVKKVSKLYHPKHQCNSKVEKSTRTRFFRKK